MWPYQNWKRINKIYFFNYQSVSYYQFQYPDRILAVVTLRCYSVEFLTSGKWVILPGDTGSDSWLSACSQLQWLRPDRSPLQAHWPLTERRQERRRPSSPTALHPLTSSPIQRVCGAYTDTTAKVCSYHQRLCSKHILAYYCYGSMQYGIFWKKKNLVGFFEYAYYYICQNVHYKDRAHCEDNSISHNAMHLVWPSISSVALFVQTGINLHQRVIDWSRRQSVIVTSEVETLSPSEAQDWPLSDPFLAGNKRAVIFRPLCARWGPFWAQCESQIMSCYAFL